MNQQLAAQALFTSIPSIGFATVKRVSLFLSEKHRKWSSVWDLFPELYKQGALTEKQYSNCVSFKASRWSEEQFLDKLSEEVVSLIGQEDINLYPQKLRSIATPPHFIYARGNTRLLSTIDTKSTLAIVGSRRNTPYGQQVTQSLLKNLNPHSQELVHISGGMYGIDLLGHRQAIRFGIPTVAVLGSGLSASYPYWQQQLMQEILESDGLLLSEYFPWSAPQKNQFIERNRIVAGLSDAVLVVEAAEKSGSLITVDFALTNGREVAAVPGAIMSRMSSGTNKLIADGAFLVRNASDLAAILSLKPKSEKKVDNQHCKSKNNEVSTQLVVYEAITASPGVTTAQLDTSFKLPDSKLQKLLSKLEISGKITRRGAGWFSSL